MIYSPVAPSSRGGTQGGETSATNTKQTNNMQTITGNTYPVREEIKALGGKWNKYAKGWNVPDDKADEARALVSGAPYSARRTKSTGYVSNVYRFSSGAEIYRNKGGRCEDAPCCGCCS